MAGLLDHVRVIEVGRYIAAPYAGKLLADMGADVIKVEHPVGGDPMRGWQSDDRPYSPQHSAYNRNKRSMTLNLKQEDGKQILLTLAQGADVVLENFRPGVMDRLGLGYEALRDRNPALIYCAITGFGDSGPYAGRPSYDTVISAMSGMYSMMLDLERPQPVGPAFSDLLSGMFAAQGVLAALVARTQSGRGQYVDVSMLSAVLAFITEAASTYADTGEVTQSDTRQRRAQAYGATSADGLPFVIHMSVPEKFWIAVTDAISRPDLRRDPRFVTRQDRYDNYYELDDLLKAAFRTKTRDAWFELFEAADLPHGPINLMGEVLADPQVQHMNVVNEAVLEGADRPIKTVGRGIGFSQMPVVANRAAPLLGEHTHELLAELGYEPGTIADLEAAGVV